jgi:hypothetical protein
MRTLRALGSGLAAAAALATSAHAAELPTVDVHVGDRALTLEGADHLGRGPVRLDFEREGGGPRTVVVFELEPGRTAEEIGPLAATSIGHVVAAVTVRPRAETAVSFEARARRYVVIDATEEQQRRAEFTPDIQHSGATLPDPDAKIVLRDRSLAISRSLPRDGVIRVRNTGRRPHHAFAIRLPAGKTAKEGIAQLRTGTTDLAQVGEPTDFASVVPPEAVLDVERRLKPGRYILVSYAAMGRRVIATTKVR